MAQHKHIAHIRRYLEKPAAERVIHTFVGSRLDCRSSLLVGIHEASLAKLQRIQNVAARIFTYYGEYSSPHIYLLWGI